MWFLAGETDYKNGLNLVWWVGELWQLSHDGSMLIIDNFLLIGFYVCNLCFQKVLETGGGWMFDLYTNFGSFRSKYTDCGEDRYLKNLRSKLMDTGHKLRGHKIWFTVTCCDTVLRVHTHIFVFVQCKYVYIQCETRQTTMSQFIWFDSLLTTFCKLQLLKSNFDFYLTSKKTRVQKRQIGFTTKGSTCSKFICAIVSPPWPLRGVKKGFPAWGW